jgi:FAD/FMN-containing dehydrogenase
MKGMKSLAKMAAAGDRDLMAATYAVHYLTDGVDAAEARAKMAVVRRIATAHGSEIANTVPTVVRGMPFAPLTNTLGPKGERWVPMHGLFAHERAVPFHHAISAFWADNADEMARLGITKGGMFMSVGSTAFVYEPTFYWPDEQTIYHHRVVPADHLATLPTYERGLEARAAVKRMKHEITLLMAEHGAAHLQIGKVYPYLDGRNAASVALLKAVKAELDPKGILNPGALGL